MKIVTASALGLNLVVLSSLAQGTSIEQNIATQNILNRPSDLTAPDRLTQLPVEHKKPTVSARKVPPESSAKVEDLVAQPELFSQLIQQMIATGKIVALEKSLPYYEKVKPRDETLYVYARGLVARNRGQLTAAIKDFRAILVNNPEYTGVRLDLATTLMMAQNDEAATYQFQEALADKKLSPETQAFVKARLADLAQRSNWQVNAGLNYLYDANINNASKDKFVTIWGLPFEKNKDSLPKKAMGWQVSADVSKQFTLHQQHKLRLSLALSHKDYNLDEFDAQDIRPDLGYVWSNGLTQAYVGGYYSAKRLNNQLIERTAGARAAGAHRLSPRWSINGSYDYSHSDFPTYTRLNGNTQALSLGASYMIKPTVSVFGGLEGSVRTAQDETLARKQWSGRVGFSQDLSRGISYSATVRYSHDRYDGEAPFFGGTRIDREWSPQLTVAWRKFNFYGFIPRLTVGYTQHSSNIPLYEYKKWSSFVTLDKKF